MKCPGCKREIAFDAMAHGCGWKLASRQGVPAKREWVRAPVSAELREKLDLLTKKFRMKAREKVDREPRREYMHEVTPGHGNVCCCEVCWAKRMPRRMPKEGDGSDMPVG